MNGKMKNVEEFFQSRSRSAGSENVFHIFLRIQNTPDLCEILTEPPQISGFLTPRVPTFVYNKNNNNRSEAKSRTFRLFGRELSALSNGYLLFVFSRIADA